MDYALLYLSAKILKNKIRIYRLIAAAVFGALYGVFSFFISPPVLLSAAVRVLATLIMTLAALFPCSIKGFFRYMLVFLALSFATGGIAFSLLFFTGLSNLFGVVFSGGVIYLNFPIYKLIFACGGSYLLMSLFFSRVKKHRSNKALIYDVTIFSGEKSITLKAFADSGNLLVEPVSKLPVIVVRKSSCDAFDTEHKTTVTIPYKSISGYGMLRGFIPDKTEVNGKEAKAYIGISEMNFGDDFDAILPCDFIERIE